MNCVSMLYVEVGLILLLCIYFMTSYFICSLYVFKILHCKITNTEINKCTTLQFEM